MNCTHHHLPRTLSTRDKIHWPLGSLLKLLDELYCKRIDEYSYSVNISQVVAEIFSEVPRLNIHSWQWGERDVLFVGSTLQCTKFNSNLCTSISECTGSLMVFFCATTRWNHLASWCINLWWDHNVRLCTPVSSPPALVSSSCHRLEPRKTVKHAAYYW